MPLFQDSASSRGLMLQTEAPLDVHGIIHQLSCLVIFDAVVFSCEKLHEGYDPSEPERHKMTPLRNVEGCQKQ